MRGYANEARLPALIRACTSRFTESYYSHWIKARRERLEERVRELWK
jgi:hypothetical protein